MAELMDHVRVFADQIGPRPVSTEEENQASLLVAQELTDDGFDVDVDEFATPTGTRWVYAAAFAAVILGTIISGIGIFVPGIAATMFVIGFVLLAAGVFVYYTEINNRPVLSTLRAGGVSQNVVAKYVPSSVAREQRRRKVIIVAHVDTVRAEPESMPALIKQTPLLRRIIYIVMIALLALELLRFLPIPWPEVVDTVLWGISLVGCVYLLCAAGCIIARKFTPYLSGANDNASSLAVMLAVAKRLVDPEERARYASQPVVGIESDELLDIEDDEGAEESIVMHSAEEAVEAGLVPEGVEISYDEPAEVVSSSAETTVIPFIDPASGEPVIPEVKPSEVEEFEESEPAVELDEVMPVVEEASDVEPVLEKPAGYQPLSSDLFAETPEESIAGVVEEQVEEISAVGESPEVVVTSPVGGTVPAGGFWPQAGDEVVTTGEPVEADAVEVEPQRLAEPEPEDDSVPSWYKAAKAKAAADTASKDASDSIGDDGKSKYRSRFASIPVTGRVQGQTPAPADTVVGEQLADSQVQQAAVVDQSVDGVADAVKEQPAVTVQEQSSSNVISLDFMEDEFDELTPDLSGVFEPVSNGAGSNASGAQEGSNTNALHAGLASAIPSVGGSERKDDAAEAAVASRQDVRSRPERRKPTARHLTQEFQPTKPVGERENKALDSMRQVAAVESNYEATPQAGPEADPFAPREERAASAAPSASAQFPSLSGQMSAVESDSLGSPGNSSSFPALTGSFPAISGAIPTVDAADFGTVDYGYEPAAQDVADDFSDPGMTSSINMPESRFHNAMDKVSGLFNRKKKNGADERQERSQREQNPDVENWDEDDDFGWKGGAYFDEGDSAFEAAKARAAEIRESVIEMTEQDLLDKEVWFVALGASSANNRGMKNFLELHGSELRGSLIINLEGVGAGDIKYVDFEGTGKSHRSDRRLQSLVKKASKEITGKELRPQKLDWRNTDATPAMLEGMRAISIMGFDGPAPANWHWTTDTSDAIDPDNLEYVTKLLLKVIENS